MINARAYYVFYDILTEYLFLFVNSQTNIEYTNIHLYLNGKLLRSVYISTFVPEL